jgi:hypothetical protein
MGWGIEVGLKPVAAVRSRGAVVLSEGVGPTGIREVPGVEGERGED